MGIKKIVFNRVAPILKMKRKIKVGLSLTKAGKKFNIKSHKN